MTDMTAEDALAYILAGGRAGDIGEWRALITAALALGFTLEGIHMMHVRAPTLGPVTLGEMLAIFARAEMDHLPPMVVAPRIKFGQVKHLASGRPADEYNENEVLQAMVAEATGVRTTKVEVANEEVSELLTVAMASPRVQRTRKRRRR